MEFFQSFSFEGNETAEIGRRARFNPEGISTCKIAYDGSKSVCLIIYVFSFCRNFFNWFLTNTKDKHMILKTKDFNFGMKI